MLKKIAFSCGVLTFLLYGQTQSQKEIEGHDRCISVGSSGALVCEKGTLDVVTAVVPLLRSANHFTGLNIFSNGVMIDTPETAEKKRPQCQESLRGTFWFRKALPGGKDSMQVCIYDSTRFAWANMDVHPEQ